MFYERLDRASTAVERTRASLEAVEGRMSAELGEVNYAEIEHYATTAVNRTKALMQTLEQRLEEELKELEHAQAAMRHSFAMEW